MSDFTDEDVTAVIVALNMRGFSVFSMDAKAVLEALGPHDRRVKAETLAELIEAMEAMSLPTQVPPHLSQDWFTGYENADREFTDWLRRRLAAIQNGADDE
jgi:hypothetical protein